MYQSQDGIAKMFICFFSPCQNGQDLSSLRQQKISKTYLLNKIHQNDYTCSTFLYEHHCLAKGLIGNLHLCSNLAVDHGRPRWTSETPRWTQRCHVPGHPVGGAQNSSVPKPVGVPAKCWGKGEIMENLYVPCINQL